MYHNFADLCYNCQKSLVFTLLHSEWPKLHRVLALLSAVGLNRESNKFTKKYKVKLHAFCEGFLNAGLHSSECYFCFDFLPKIKSVADVILHCI